MLHYDSINDYFQTVIQYRDVTNMDCRTILDNTYTRCMDDHESVCIEHCIASELAGAGEDNNNSRAHYITDV